MITVVVSYENVELQNDILQLYLAKKEECIHSLPDNYSVIIKDDIRDIVIAKKGAFSPAPVYYTYWKTTIYCEFTMTDLICIYPGPLKPNKEKIAEYLSFGAQTGVTINSCFYENIYRLLPGEAILLKAGSQPTFFTTSAIDIIDRNIDKQSNVVAIRNSFIESVVQKVENSKKIAANLSGGLDSSSVNCVAQTIRKDQVLSVYIDTHTEQAEEFFFAEKVSEKHKTHLLKISLDSYQNLDAIKQCVLDTSLPETYNLPSPFTRAIIDTCIANNIDTLLSGFLGDQVIGQSYNHYEELARNQQWLKLKNTLIEDGVSEAQTRALIVKKIAKVWFKKPGINALRILDDLLHNTIGYGRIDTLSSLLLLLGQKHSQRRINRYNKYLKKLVLRSSKTIDGDKRIFDPLSVLSKKPQEDQLKMMHSIYQYIAVEAMEQHYQLFKKAGTRVEYPFFNKSLVEQTLQSKSEWKKANGLSRITLREALADYLPTEIYKRRTKAKFNSYVHQNFVRLQNEFKRSCGKAYETHPIWELVDKSYFEKIAALLTENKLSTLESTSFAFLASRVVYLAIWLDYVKNRTVQTNHE